MLMFTLAVSYLTTSNLPWFMDLIFQVTMQYFSLQHWTLLSSPITSTTGCCFCFVSLFSFFLELFLHCSPVAYWATGEFIFQCPIFLPFHTVHGVLKQEYQSGLPFPSPVDHVLSEFSTMIHPSWMALYDMAHSFVELAKAVVQAIRLVSFLWLWFSFCLHGEG